jgi:hypothetical protein
VTHDPWRDVYLNYKQYEFAQAQVGKFKVPFSLDENTSPMKLDFVYRSRIAALLAPGRDLGVMVHGRVLNRGWLRYELGVFNADGSNARTFDTERVHGERLAGRAVARPAIRVRCERSGRGVSFTRAMCPRASPTCAGEPGSTSSFYRPGIPDQRPAAARSSFEALAAGPFSIKSVSATDERMGRAWTAPISSRLSGPDWYERTGR